MEPYTGLDAEEDCNVYGTVINKHMRRRKGIRPSPPVVITNAPTSEKIMGSQTTQFDGNSINNASTSGRLSLKSQSGARSSNGSDSVISKGSQEKSKAPANPSQLRRDSSSIFKSFAKAKPKLNREGTDSSAGASGLESATPSGAEDEAMKDMSEDEEESYVPPVQTSSKSVVRADRKSRKEREAALRNMMDEDDPDQEPKPAPLEVESHEVTEEAHASQPTEEAAQIISGRRREEEE